MNIHEIWSVAGAIIASVGGAGIIICAASSFLSARIAKRLDAKYEQRLNKELEKVRSDLEHRRYVTKTQFDREFEIYSQLSKAFFSMTVKLTFFTEQTFLPEELSMDDRESKVEEFMQIIKVTGAAQDLLYENAAFIPRHIFDLYKEIYDKANNLFWIYNGRLKLYVSNKMDYSDLVTASDLITKEELNTKLDLLNIALREYLETLSVIE